MGDGRRNNIRVLWNSMDDSKLPKSPSEDSSLQVAEAERPLVIADGVLRLSGRGWSSLSPIAKDNLSEVRALDISQNCFRFVGSLSNFKNCEKILAGRNNLNSFASFKPLSGKLKHLDVSYNEINDFSHLSSFSALVWLSAVNNCIQNIPPPLLSKLTCLTYVDLSENKIDSLFDIRGLADAHSLEVLNLQANMLSSLQDCHRCLPPSLRSLNVSANSIVDLREALHLAYLEDLDSLSWSGNPCVRSEGRRFDYRPFLRFCCPNSLRAIDGFEVTEMEILKCELLQTKGKVRRMESHAALCAYLTHECPLDVPSAEHSSHSSFDQQLQKVLAKRREYLSSANNTDESLSYVFTSATPSPYSQWMQKDRNCCSSFPNSLSSLSAKRKVTVEQKGNKPLGLSLSAGTCRISHKRQEAVANGNDNAIDQTPRIRKQQAASRLAVPKRTKMRNVKSKTPVARVLRRTLNSAAVRSRWKTAVQNAEVAIMPRRSTAEILRPRRLFGSPHPEKAAIVSAVWPEYTAEQKKAVLVIQSWWRGVRMRKTMRLRILERRVRLIEERSSAQNEAIRILSLQCEQLSKIKEEQTNTIAELSAVASRLADAVCCVQSIFPVPTELHFERRSRTSVAVEWKNRVLLQPLGYNVFVNGVMCGTVRAVRNKTIISDLDSDRENKVVLQGFMDDKILCKMSEPLIIPPYPAVPEEAVVEEENNEMERH